MKIINSNIAIDMGGKYTGVVSYTSDKVPASEDINALVINMPETGSGINYTVKERTSVRHRIRSLDRFKKARKLIFQVISFVVNRDLSSDEKEAISSLMKRRGYTRLESEIDLEILNQCSTEFFADNIDCINNDSPLLEQFSSLTCSLDKTKEFLSKIQVSDLDEKIKDISDKNEKALCKDVLKIMKEACGSMISQEQFGHKHRSQYLEAIKADLEKDSRLKNLIECIGSSERLYRCVGNISNLQLRALRWYFNDISMKSNTMFKPDRFKKVWIRAYQFFHYPEKEEVVKLLNEIMHSDNIVETLGNIDPARTIPPYEDQNNRRPPIDQTLLLNPSALDEKYPDKWEKWTDLFVSKKSEITEKLDEIVILTDRKSRRCNTIHPSYTYEKIKHSYALQRLFDLSKGESLISNIRAWANNPEGRKNLEINELINNLLGNDADEFLQLAQEYYRECDYAKRGLWSLVEKPILEVSSIHPPMKKKAGVMADMVSAVLCINKVLDLEKFKKEIWNVKVKGNSTVRSICKSIEDTRKAYGNAFKQEYEFALEKQQSDPKSLSKEEKDLVKLSETVAFVADYIFKNLNGNDLDSPKYANPFSLAQLYTILESDPHGFSSNCPAVIKENAWRMQSYDGLGAICSRLVAETVRPFDGSLGKILDKQAYEIASRKVKEILSIPNLTDTLIKLGIVIESNQFEFSASIAKIKKSGKYKKIQASADRGLAKQELRWEEKSDRIKRLSNNICAYTGDELDGVICEIDHIIPRSFTKEFMGTVFNSEANLIYVSQKGNQTKKENLYHLKDLHPKYLLSIFGTANVQEINNKIEDTVKKVLKKNPRFIFELMSVEEMQCVKHALFMSYDSEAYKTVLNAMAKIYSTRVNGSQAWFVRAIILKIKSLLSDWLKSTRNTLSFEAWKVSGEETHRIRESLANLDPNLGKKDIQPITSHAIDALCILASACVDEKKSSFLGENGCLNFLYKPENLIKVIPEQFEISDVSRKPFTEKDKPESRKLYKETIYGEHFIPVMVLGDIVKVGFNWKDNCFEVSKGADKLLELLSPFFNEQFKMDNKFHSYSINKEKAFDYLHKASVSSCDKTMLDTVNCIQNLYYSTRKVAVVDSIYDSTKHKFKTESEVLNNKKFDIKLKTTFTKEIKLKANNSGNLELPAISSWKQILSQFNEYIGKSIDKGDELVRKELGSTKFSSSSKLKHKRVKQDFSLPMLDGPSGGIRVKRFNYDNKAVYQLVAANTPETVTSQGFPVENNKINWNGSVPLPIYSEDNLTSVDIENNQNDIQTYVKMAEQRLVYRDDNLKVMMSPGTRDRRYVFIEQDFESFKTCLNDVNVKSPLDLSNEIKLKDSDCKSFAQSFNKLTDSKVDVGIPRGVLKITSIGKIISYYYSVQSSNSNMNSAFEKA